MGSKGRLLHTREEKSKWCHVAFPGSPPEGVNDGQVVCAEIPADSRGTVVYGEKKSKWCHVALP